MERGGVGDSSRAGYRGVGMSGLGRVIRQSRQQASLSLHVLAVASGVSHSEIHKLENGESAAPKITTLTKLSGALGVPLQVLLEASGTDVRQPAGELREAGTLLDPEALRLRLRAGADSGAPGSSDAGVSLVLPTKRLTKRQQAHYEEQLALICRMAFDARGWLMPVVRGYSRELNGRFSDQTLSHDAHAATYLGRSQLIYGMTFVEELPPPPSARAMLRRAQRNARASEDWSTYYQALWREAEQFRKAGDHYVSNDPRRTLKLYHQALQRLKLILRDDHRAPLAALKSAHAEWAKV